MGDKKMIERYQGKYTGRNRACAYRDLVWTVGTAQDDSLNLADQTRKTLQAIEKNLADAGSDKHSIVNAVVYITDINAKKDMDDVWKEWIGDDPENWPQRACVGTQLAGNTLVEITVTAVRSQGTV